MNTFENLGVNPAILPALAELGYESPSPIQEQSIPLLLNGQDLLAQAQTGTGKTAAFALPILSQLDLKLLAPQTLVLAPTRELAIQVAEAFQAYAKHLPGFHVLPIYGGQDFRPQLKALKRGVHVIVGTPGRVMDHMRRGSLLLDNIKTLVLDEADEMLKMGFIDDVKWVLQQIPAQRQMALFSATVPSSIRRIAEQHLQNPAQVKIKSKTTTVEATEQFYTLVSQQHKLEVLTRFLEVEEFDATIVFTQTKIASAELAEKLKARGYAAAAINGDMNQEHRERVIRQIKRGNLDIVVATEVAARGLDVERFSHVINYDIPYDPESYTHRIGRTGRAGRKGKALLFVTPREKRMLKTIERATRQAITPIEPPSVTQINQKREEIFTKKIIKVLNHEDLDTSRELIEKIAHQTENSELDIAAALAFLTQEKKPPQTKDDELKLAVKFQQRERKKKSQSHNTRGYDRRSKQAEAGMTQCRLEVGRTHGLRPSDVVGMIANKANINRKAIGRIHIFDKYTLVDLSEGVAHKVIKAVGRCKLKKQNIAMAVV